MTPLFFATRAHILVCVGPQCGKRGSRELLTRTSAALEKEHIVYYKSGGTVRLTATSCLGACAYGPNVTAYYGDETGQLREAWYAGVDDKRLSCIATALHQGEEAPSEGRYDR